MAMTKYLLESTIVGALGAFCLALTRLSSQAPLSN